jgi:hypothetical protein
MNISERAKRLITYALLYLNANMDENEISDLTGKDEEDVDYDTDGEPLFKEVAALAQQVRDEPVPTGTESQCPNCGHDLEYDGGEVQDEDYIYDVSCPNCDWTGKECYALKYTQQIANGEDEQWKTYDTPQDVCPRCGEKEKLANEDGPDDQGRLPVTCHECGCQWYEPNYDAKAPAENGPPAGP